MPVVPKNTALRLKVHYSGPFGRHTMLFHGQTGTPLATLVASVDNIIGLMKDACWDGVTFDSAEYSNPGSDFFTPYAGWVAKTASNGIAPNALTSPSIFLQFGGRSTATGVRAKWYLFEVRESTNPKMRYPLGTNGRVDGIIAALDNEAGVIAAVDGSEVVAYHYANIGENDFLTHKARRG